MEKAQCLYCEKESLHGKTHTSCMVGDGIDEVKSIFWYTPHLKKIITNIKYRLVRDALPELFALIEPTRLVFSEDFCSSPLSAIQPIPLYPSRFRQRGFNQAELIAKHVSKLTQYPVVSLIERVRETQAQAQTHSKKERIDNMREAFKARNEEGRCRSVILIDDVVTTGSTVKAAAKALKSAGVSKIAVFSLARG
jgi:competence protein ComFC